MLDWPSLKKVMEIIRIELRKYKLSKVGPAASRCIMPVTMPHVLLTWVVVKAIIHLECEFHFSIWALYVMTVNLLYVVCCYSSCSQFLSSLYFVEFFRLRLLASCLMLIEKFSHLIICSGSRYGRICNYLASWICIRIRNWIKLWYKDSVFWYEIIFYRSGSSS